MEITSLRIPNVKLLVPAYFTDSRGWFAETYSKRTLAAQGITAEFVQDNHSLTLHKGTIRGIHFQRNPKAQGKLMRCVRGRILDVAVDLRQDSPTYRQWVSEELSAENHRQLWIPQGFGHGFLTLEDHCEVQYKTDEFYAPECDGGIAWNDPEIAVDWGGVADPILSDKDRALPLLARSGVYFSREETT